MRGPERQAVSWRILDCDGQQVQIQVVPEGYTFQKVLSLLQRWQGHHCEHKLLSQELMNLVLSNKTHTLPAL